MVCCMFNTKTPFEAMVAYHQLQYIITQEYKFEKITVIGYFTHLLMR